MRLVMDIEGNGLREDITKIWCIVAKDIDTKELFKYAPDTLQEGIELLSKAKTLIGHNIIDYDIPVLGKIYSFKYSARLVDTLVISRLLYPDRPRPDAYTGKGGPHSLEAWGWRVGRGKPDHDDWSQYSPGMLHRCSEDVEINELVYYQLMREIES